MPASRVARGMVGATLALVPATVGAVVVPAAPAAADQQPVRHRTVFSYTDRDITESSGLVAREDVVFTVNDSGHPPVVFAVDRDTGDTVGRTTYSVDGVSDVEAVAPGEGGPGGGALWVGDTGDNNHDRPSIAVYRVPMAHPRGDRTVDAARYDLVYPDGPHDAETLLVHPRTGRLLVVSKGILGGTVYAAPAALDPSAPNRMRTTGQVPGLITDGAFFPDGRHLVLRTYGTAAVYTFPGLDRVGSFPLPAQEQGEAIAVDPAGRVLIGTEGVYTAVQQIVLPAAVQAAVGGDAPTRPPSAAATPAEAPSPATDATDPASDRLSLQEGDGVWWAGGLLVVVAAGWFYLTVVRRRSRRS